MNEQLRRCPVCQLDDQQVLAEEDRGEKVTYECSRCGTYTITRSANGIPEKEGKAAELSAWLRERNLLGVEIPLLHTIFLKELIKTLPVYTVSEKRKKLLKALERKTDYPGREVILIPERDLSLAWARNETEFKYYIKSLMEQGLVDIIDPKVRSLADPLYPLVITAAGWEHIEEDGSDISSKAQAFVAMSFDKGLFPIYETAVSPAIESTGYRPYRVDAEPHLDRIDAKIIAEIKNSRFMVADVTQQKSGVYYEAGFAHGLGIPVIWSVRHDDLKNVHFDTRQYNHIVWENETELRDRLRDFILATIGKR